MQNSYTNKIVLVTGGTLLRNFPFYLLRYKRLLPQKTIDVPEARAKIRLSDGRRAPARSAARRPMVMSGVPASDGRYTPARPASHLWSASVDVLRRTRRNAYTIKGAAPEVNHRTSRRGSRGSASLPAPTAERLGAII